MEGIDRPFDRCMILIISLDCGVVSIVCRIVQDCQDWILDCQVVDYDCHCRDCIMLIYVGVDIDHVVDGVLIVIVVVLCSCSL